MLALEPLSALLAALMTAALAATLLTTLTRLLLLLARTILSALLLAALALLALLLVFLVLVRILVTHHTLHGSAPRQRNNAGLDISFLPMEPSLTHAGCLLFAMQRMPGYVAIFPARAAQNLRPGCGEKPRKSSICSEA